jgi:hypothetical protein
VEVDLGKGLMKAIQLTLDNWTYIRHVDYEQLPFKCNTHHEYGHFAKIYPKSQPFMGVVGDLEKKQLPKKKRVVGK